MIRRLIPVCAASACGTPAVAQSTITVSGVMDLAARQVSNEGVGSMKALVSCSNATSRVIFSGREDLGDGLSAGFHLEHGLLADTGSVMPSVDGMEATRRLRRDADLAAVPVITISASATAEHRAACLQAGVNVFLTKPVSLDTLQAHIEEQLGLQGIEPTAGAV